MLCAGWWLVVDVCCSLFDVRRALLFVGCGLLRVVCRLLLSSAIVVCGLFVVCC